MVCTVLANAFLRRRLAGVVSVKIKGYLSPAQFCSIGFPRATPVLKDDAYTGKRFKSEISTSRSVA